MTAEADHLCGMMGKKMDSGQVGHYQKTPASLGDKSP